MCNNIGKIVTEIEQKIWKNYIAKLFEDEREHQTNTENIEGESGPDIIKDEIVENRL